MDKNNFRRWGYFRGWSSFKKVGFIERVEFITVQWDGLYLRGCSSFERVSLNLNLRDIFKGDGYLRG